MFYAFLYKPHCTLSSSAVRTNDSRSMSRKWFLPALLAMCPFVSPLSAQSVSGKVIDALSKMPVVHATVAIVELKKECTTDSMGFYKLDGLSKGNYSIRFDAPQYVRLSKTVKVIDYKGQTGSVDMTLDVMLFSISSNAEQSKGPKEITYFFPGHTDVVIEICDSAGKKVRTTFDRTRSGGMRTFHWNGMDNWGKMVPAGKYTCKLKSGNLYTSKAIVWSGVEKRD